MHKWKSKRNIVLAIICCTIVTMTVVCASFSQNMFINGNAYVRSSNAVRITNVAVKSATNGAQNTFIKYSSKKMIFDASLPNIDSEIVYTVSIKNNSNSDVYLIKNVTESLSNVNITSDSSEYINQIIGKGQTIDVDITFKYGVETLPEAKNQSGTLIFTFEQPSAALITYSSEYTDATNLQDAIDELYNLVY